MARHAQRKAAAGVARQHYRVLASGDCIKKHRRGVVNLGGSPKSRPPPEGATASPQRRRQKVKKLSKTERVRRARKAERVRGVLYGDLCHVLRCRYGDQLPDDETGDECLLMLLELASLRDDPHEQMTSVIEKWAPWISEDSVEECIDRVLRLPWRERKRANDSIGRMLRLRSDERERLRVWSILPCNMDARELEEHRKMKHRERERQRRARTGARPREVFLATNSLSKLEPWKAEGISRSTWYERRAKAGPDRSMPDRTYYISARTCPTGTAPWRCCKWHPGGGW